METDFLKQRLSEDKMKVLFGGDPDDTETKDCPCSCPGEDSTKTTGLHGRASLYAFNNNPPVTEIGKEL